MRMQTVLSGIMGLFCAAWFSSSCATDIVSFNSPGQWVTQRSDAIVAKVQLDTSKIPQKKIEFSLSKVEDGKKKLIATKTFKVTDYTQEYKLGSAASMLCGGKDFLRIDWSIPGTKEKGMLFPVGVVNLDKLPKIEPFHAAKVKDAIYAKNWASLIGGVKYTSVKGNEFGLLWTPKSLVVVCKKTQTKDIVRFAFDAKNGKNAFMSHPDRTIDLYQGKDSLGTLFFERAFVNDTLAYNLNAWQSDIAKLGDKQTAVIVVPWYDLGMLPLDERTFGFAAFVVDDKAKTLAAVPEKAAYFVPGSWGTVVLDK
jgi:hypothetical protein